MSYHFLLDKPGQPNNLILHFYYGADGCSQTTSEAGFWSHPMGWETLAGCQKAEALGFSVSMKMLNPQVG